MAVTEKRREYKRLYALSYKKNFPWLTSYYASINRCKKAPTYVRRNIKVLMTKDEFKFLWFRDNAFNLERPNIDRIDPFGNYELNNCRYIEFKENMARKRQCFGWDRYIQCSICNKNTNPYESKGMCKKCYRKYRYEKYEKEVPAKTGWDRHIQCLICKSTKHPHQAKGLCHKCYKSQWNKKQTMKGKFR